MENERSMAGWIGFAGLMILIIGGLDVFQGLILSIESAIRGSRADRGVRPPLAAQLSSP